MRVLLYLAMGGVIGTVSGILGIGGGILLIPALIWLGGFDYPKAAGTTLAIMVPPIGLLAAWESYTKGRVDLTAAIWIALSFAVSAWFGATLVPLISDAMLRLSFGILMMILALRFILSASTEASNAAAGLFAVALAWVVYLWLRALGRRHLKKPDLGECIREQATKGRGEGDYQI